MNSLPTLGTFVLLLFACCTPTQGNFQVNRITFETGESYGSRFGKTVTLAKFLGHPLYEIQEIDSNAPEPTTRTLDTAVWPTTVKEFGIKGIDTIVGKDVVLRTDDNKWAHLELICGIDAQRLFTMTTRRNLGDAIYSYKLPMVDVYQGQRPMKDLTISGFEYTTRENPQHRYIIHTREAFDKDSELILLWTQKDFNYFVFDKNTILLTVCPKRGYYEYYLIKFADKADYDNWCATPGKLLTQNVPKAPKNVENHFRDIVSKRTVTRYRFR